MLEQGLLDHISKIKLRKPFHTALEIALILGLGVPFISYFYQPFRQAIYTQNVETFMFLFLFISIPAIAYVYTWHRFSVAYDNSNTKNKIAPVYFNALRFLSFSSSILFCFFVFFFLNFEFYRFDITPKTAQATALFFGFLGFTQFVYSLLTPSKLSKRKQGKA